MRSPRTGRAWLQAATIRRIGAALPTLFLLGSTAQGQSIDTTASASSTPITFGVSGSIGLSLAAPWTSFSGSEPGMTVGLTGRIRTARAEYGPFAQLSSYPLQSKALTSTWAEFGAVTRWYPFDEHRGLYVEGGAMAAFGLTAKNRNDGGSRGIGSLRQGRIRLVGGFSFGSSDRPLSLSAVWSAPIIGTNEIDDYPQTVSLIAGMEI